MNDLSKMSLDELMDKINQNVNVHDEEFEHFLELKRRGDALAEALEVIQTALNDGSNDAEGSFWEARAWLDLQGIFNSDLSGLRVLFAVCSKSIKQWRGE